MNSEKTGPAAIALAGLLLVHVAWAPGIARAGKRYVSDRLIITLRDTPGRDGKSIRSLHSDMPVTVLEESGRYIKIKTDEGETGWVAAQYITAEKPRAQVVRKLEKKIIRLEGEIAALEKEQEALEKDSSSRSRSLAGQVRELKKSLKEKEQEAVRLAGELSRVTEAHALLQEQKKGELALMAERDRLGAENKRLKAEADQLREEVVRLQPVGTLYWFLAGAGVLAAGLIGGILLTRRNRYYIGR